MSCSHAEKTTRVRPCRDPTNCDEIHPHLEVVCEDCGFKIGELAG